MLLGRPVPWPPVVAAVLGVLGVAVAVLAPGGEDRQDRHDRPEDAVLNLFAARDRGSCEDYVATTTPFFRNDAYLGAPTCEDVADEAAEYAALRPVEVEVVSVVRVGADTAEVETVERYRAGTDGEYAVAMAYRAKRAGDVWAVDHVDLTVLPGG